MIKTYEDALNFIHGRTKHKKIPTLSRMAKFLALLGDPQETVQSIHIAGTNGKGSTVAFLRQMLMAAGYHKVGTFTSPFLIRFNERISISGQPVPDDELVKLVQIVEPVVARLDQELPTGGPTEFEIDTALMWLYFAQQKVDVAVVEVGVGGALDSTNIIKPVVSVIVSIGMDHMNLLGDNLTAIAYQKAGIMRKDVPVVIGQLNDEALKAVEKSAKMMESPLYRLGFEFQAAPLLGDHSWHENFAYTFGEQTPDLVQLSLIGHYQVNNAAVALAACQLFLAQQRKHFYPRKIINALSKTTWPGRFEPLSFSPLVIIDENPVDYGAVFPNSDGFVYHADKVFDGSNEVGISVGRTVVPYYHRMISLGFVSGDTKFGKELTILWGDPQHRQKKLRAKVSYYPYIGQGESQRDKTSPASISKNK